MAETTEQNPGGTWLEVALNGPWGRDRQPGIPVTVEEIVEQGIACVEAGAAIVHVHAYDAATGRQRDDADLYARIIGGIRSKVDAIVYPTIPFAGSRDSLEPLEASERYAHVEQLARLNLLEWAVVDPGSCNITHWDQIRSDEPGFVYRNDEQTVRHAMSLARRYQFHPSYAIYEPGFLRLGAALHWRESTLPPIYRFMFTSDYSFGFPPEDYAITAYLNLLDQLAPGAQWMAGGLGVDVLPLIPRVVSEGGHIRVGLEDSSFGATASNVDLVRAAVEAIDAMGATVATAADVRARLAPEQ